MYFRRFQSVTLILVWLILLGTALSLAYPRVLVASCFALVLAFLWAPANLKRIFRRSRWLMGSLLILFAWLTPGYPIPLTFGATTEGIHMAGEQIGRLLLCIAAVSLLLQALDRSALVAGLRAIAMPFGALSVNCDRVALRLALTLDHIERVDLDSSITFLHTGITDDSRYRDLPQRIEIPLILLAWPDYFVLGTALLALGLTLW